MAQASAPVDTGNAAKRRSTVIWVVAIAAVGLIFDGYDLVVYGAVLPQFLAPGGLIFNELTPEHQQALSAWAASGPHLPTDPVPAGVAAAQGAAKGVGGLLGSYALFGVLVGALVAGTFGDILGRRKVMLVAYAWFSIGMGVTAMMTSVAAFGWMRFITGLGVGALVATTGAIVAEYAPPGKKNLCNAIVYCGVPLGSMISALLAIVLLPVIGWRGVFWIGALPLVTLLPIAFFKLPESVAWLVSRGRMDEAAKVAQKTGMPIPVAPSAAESDPEALAAAKAAAGGEGRAGWAGLFSGSYLLPTLLLGLMSATGLLLVYSLNTWLPALMTPLLGARASLALLLVLNGGAVIGALFGSRFADKFGPKPTVAACFLIGAVAIFLLTVTQVLGLLLIIIAIVGIGTSGTQTLIYGLVANYYRTNVRGAGVAWCAGFGRLGGVGGPILGGILAARYADNLNMVFIILAGVGIVGMVLCLVTPRAKSEAAPLLTLQPTVPTQKA